MHMHMYSSFCSVWLPGKNSYSFLSKNSYSYKGMTIHLRSVLLTCPSHSAVLALKCEEKDRVFPFHKCHLEHKRTECALSVPPHNCCVNGLQGKIIL